MSTDTLCKTVAVIIFLSLVVQPQVLIIVPLIERGGIGFLFAAMLLTVLAMAIISIVGVWRGRWWGFVAFYGYAITSTPLLGSAVIPFVMIVVPTDARVVTVIGLNALSVVAVAFLQWQHSKQSAGAA